MIDKKKIITKTKLAIYDKLYLSQDDKVTDYFRHDYVYKKNTWDRFFAILGGMIILFFYYGHKVFVGNVHFTTIDFKNEAKFIAIFFIVILVMYSIIGSIKHNSEYTTSLRRQKKHISLLRQLYKIPPDENKKKETFEN